MSIAIKSTEESAVSGLSRGPEMQEWNGRSAQARKPCSMQGCGENEEKMEMREEKEDEYEKRKREEMKRRRRREER